MFVMLQAEDSATTLITLISVSVVLLLIIWFLSKAIVIVHVAEGVVIERLGSFRRTLKPGFNLINPILDEKRLFSWRKTFIDINKRVREESCNLYRVDCREALFNFIPQEVYTRDTIQLEVNALMYYRIVDVKKAMYGVDDLHMAVGNVAQAEIKMLFGSMTFTEALSAQDRINEYLVPKFNKEFSAWGVVANRVEILDYKPSESVVRQLKLQMLAERNRRAEFIVAEGKKSAMRLQSEGTRVERYQMGIAEQESTRRISEGQAQAKVLIAQAESKSLNMVQEAIKADGASQSEYLITEKYLNLYDKVLGSSKSTGQKHIYLPYAAEQIMGLVSTLPKTYGSVNALKKVQQNRAGARGGDDFDELN